MCLIKKANLKKALVLLSKRYAHSSAQGAENTPVLEKTAIAAAQDAAASAPNLAADSQEEPVNKKRYGFKKGFKKLAQKVRNYREKKMKADSELSPKIVFMGGRCGGEIGAEGGAIAAGGAGAGIAEPKIDISHIEKSYLSRQYRDDELKYLDLKYPLSPLNPRAGEKIFAWASIKWNNETNSIIYYVNEFPISEEDVLQIKKIKQIIEEKIDIPFDALQASSAVGYLKNAINSLIVKFGIFVPEDKRTLYEYYILRDFIGLNRLQPLFNDPDIEDISCDGVNIPVFVYHRNPLIGSIKTNVVFTTKDELDDFVMKLSQKCGRSISVSEPLSEGALPDGSRVQATLGTDIARRGSNFTIRKFTSDPLTPIHLLVSGTLNEKMLAYLWFAIENNVSALISGPTASGKTSLLNALSLFIKPSLKIVTIEDTPELKLPHVHWVPEVSRQGIFGLGGHVVGSVSMFDLLRGSLRQRPDYIIVGEVRGEEAYVLFQQMASGHSGLSTIHADSVDKIVDRLTTPPINLPPMLLETLDLIIFIKHLRHHGKYVRRVMEVQEILKYDTKEKAVKTLRVFKWSPRSDVFETESSSALLNKIALDTGINEEQVKSEINKRIKVLTWLKMRNITNYKDVGRIISAFYSNPEEVLDEISG